MENYQSHLKVASGYLELGMIDEAAEEVENIAPEDKTLREVLEFRLDLCRAARQVDGIEAVARYLLENHDWSPQWILDLAWALRRTTGIPEARAILEKGEIRFPDCGVIRYKLACYACVEGDMQTTKTKLKEAFRLDPDLKLAAIDDSGLEALWEELGKIEG